MLHISYKIHDIKLLLELNDSARQTLLIILNQLNGSLSGTIDRSNMNNAEKQKIKRGITELKEKGFITKSIGSRGCFNLNPHIIHANTPKTREEHYSKSGLYRNDCDVLLGILIAIEHFFDEFYNKPFIIKFKVYTNTPRIPATVFLNMVQYTEDNYPLKEEQYSYGSVLNQFIHVAEFIKYYCDSRQEFLVITDDVRAEIVDIFNSAIYRGWSGYPSYRKAEADALCKFILGWFSDNYPEFLL